MVLVTETPKKRNVFLALVKKMAVVKMDTATAIPNNTNNHTNSNNIKQYGRIILSLENCLLPKDKIEVTCSAQDGLDKETELELRILGSEMIQTAGILLKLPQVAMATGQVLFHRFFYSKSFVRYNYEVVAMGCVCLASKIEEAPRRIRDVINVIHHIKQIRGNRTIQPMILDQNYINLKNQVIKAERRVLKELGFCVHVKHPHKIIVMYLQVLELKNNQHLTQLAWNYMNDSLRTDVFLRFSPETIACTCIYLSARQLKIPLPNKPAWFHIFRVEEEDVKEICLIILKLYARPKCNVEKLEKQLEELKKAQEDAKLKARGLLQSASNTPQGAGFSPNSRSNSPGKGEKSPTDIKKDKSQENNNKNRTYDGHVSPRRAESNKDNNNHTSKGQSPSSNASGGAKSGASHSSRSRSLTPKHKSSGGGGGHHHTSRNAGGGGYKRSRGKSISKSRSKSPDRGGGNHKKPRGRSGGASKHSRRSRSPSPAYVRSPIPPHHRNHKKNHKDKLRYRSRSRDVGGGGGYRSRSRSYDKYSSGAAKGGSGGGRKDRRVAGRDNGHHRSRSNDRNHRR